ncbi:bifunctional tetrahydrofolate synthase/dihydrofolate synthase [Lysobacter enzymogenes]|uniref:Dihydrofolate synthase/folylpolyglutamate synthase n=1 Tax=Lysobacter enzymogenes TaxID=69 RepID=A0A3N2RCP3_LYSEN|nr:bifunctional tetrahydrofolate synthase/dihydrofolate synthase [Lysobacter enzymogenes]ROU05213.1 bifunctional tetrahydrofolate synthase/dihydrofolate synthase [Lysobacter enzymogenes]
MQTRSLADWLSHIERIHPKSIDMGLDRIREVHQRLGLTRPGREVITVGGTNGKGSTVAFIEAIARADGRRVGAYTSPHLLAYNERIRIDGADAADADIVAAFEAIEAARGEVALTYFEYGTLAALWLFERAGLDLAILEVGLGGRLDATNIVDADVAVITTVDLDHQDYLGDDRESIGFEKAGIARGFKPLVLGDDDPPSSVLRHAYLIGASAVRAGCDFFFAPAPDDEARWNWREVGFEVELPRPALSAPVQMRNAAVAIAALRALDAAPGDEALARGVAQARVAGRLQRFERGGAEILVDVGHNPQAARELAAWLDAQPPRPTRAVFAALGDKDAAGVVAALGGRIAVWHLAGLSGPRGVSVEAFAERLRGGAAETGQRHDSVAEALAAARAAAGEGERILVFGSFHTAAEALQALADG